MSTTTEITKFEKKNIKLTIIKIKYNNIPVFVNFKFLREYKKYKLEKFILS